MLDELKAHLEEMLRGFRSGVAVYEDHLVEALAKLEPFEADPIGATLKAVAQELGIKAGVLVHPTRLACCGNPAGPSLYHLLAILGKERALQRIDRALARMG